MKQMSFDFGKRPLSDSRYIKIKSDTLYSEEQGYGLYKEAVAAMVRDTGDKEIYRDYLLMGNNTFRVDIPNGMYKVRVATGDYDHDGDVVTRYTVNGVQNGAWVNDGTVIEKVFEIEVTDGKLLFEFSEGKHPALNVIEITPKRYVSMTQVKAKVTATKTEHSVYLWWDKIEGISYYHVRRINLRNGETEYGRDVLGEEFIDENADLCREYRYEVNAIYGQHFYSKSMTGVDVNIVDGGEVEGDVSDLVAIETPKAIHLSWKGCDSAIYYNVYCKAPYGKYRRVGRTLNCNYTDKTIPNVEFEYGVEAVTTSGKTNFISTKTKITEPRRKRKMETLNRALVAVKVDDGVFLSWRLNAYEYEKGFDFVLYRNGERISPIITDSTNYKDADGKIGDEYTVYAVFKGRREKNGYSAKVWEKPYLSIPLDKPDDITLPDGRVCKYTPNDCSVGDLDGDGEYEIILRWDAGGKDNSHKGYTGNCLIDAYKLNGKKLWRIDMGINIRSGAHYTQFMVYDFNNDGKAEMICKTADGTVDGVGNIIGDAVADWRNHDGYILEGPEYLTLFNGETGEAIDTVEYEPPRGNVRDWGDSWGNRVDRFLACVAYLDGENPSVVMCRGYYDHGCPTVLVAYDVIGNRLVKRWKFLANKDQNIEYTNQGNHNLGVGDIDGDGLDEIVYGAMAVDHDGIGIYSTGLEHGDCMNLGNFTKKTPNLDFFQIHEHAGAEYGFEVRDPATGEIKWGFYTGRDTTRGLCAKIDPRYEGNQCWVMEGGLYTMEGELINKKEPGSINFAIWWDGDLIRELLDCVMDENDKDGYPKIYKWDYENNKLITLLDPAGTLSNNWRKGNPCIQADILGDWREEAIWRSDDNRELRVYTTTHLTKHKFYTLMHDHVYRLSVAFQNTAYNQCTQTGFYIGPEMDEPPIPRNEYVRGTDFPDFTEYIE